MTRAVRCLSRVLSLALGLSGTLLAREQFFNGNVLLNHPWFTGPILAPASNALPYGLAAVQANIFEINRYGHYQANWHQESIPCFHSLVVSLPVAYGLGDRLDVQVIPRFLYNSHEGQHSTQLGDWALGFGIQLHRGALDSWIPSVKFGFREYLPMGRFDHLNPTKLGTQVSGTGSFGSMAGFSIRKLLKFSEVHYLSTVLNLRAAYYTPAHVKGLSLYGGAPDTCGQIYPGMLCEVILSAEYSLTDNWALALDCEYLHQNRDRFCGYPGMDSEGAPAVVGDPSSELFSFCPAIEYNFRAGFGIIAGVWFSAAGRNAPAFANFAMDVVYVF